MRCVLICGPQVDCLKVQDIHGWLEQLPQACFTLIFDCEQNFVASYGKQHDPEVLDIMEDPWSTLTSLDSSTVVFYLRPDIIAMAKLQDRDEDVRGATGTLTEGINFVLPRFALRRGGEGAELGVCHKMFYEAISFYWHKRGRRHKAFVPAVGVSGHESDRWLVKLQLLVSLWLCGRVLPGRCQPRIHWQEGNPMQTSVQSEFG